MSTAQYIGARLIAYLLSVPSPNLVDRSQYVQQLETIGYKDIGIEDITEHVFPGFTAYLESRGALWPFFARVVRFWSRAGARFVIVSASRRPDDQELKHQAKSEDTLMDAGTMFSG